MTGSAFVYVQDGGFLVSDSAVPAPFEMMDYSTGLGGIMPSTMLVAAGIDRGLVEVTAEALSSRPALNTQQDWETLAGWDDAAEFTLFCPHGDLRVDRLEYGPHDPRIDLPVLSAQGPGHYRVRLYARGRDRHRDQVVEESDESFRLLAWPAPLAPPLIIKSSSRCGYSLRFAQFGRSPQTTPLEPAPQRQETATRQAMLNDVLRNNRSR